MENKEAIRQHRFRKAKGLVKLYVPKALIIVILNLIVNLTKDKELKDYYRAKKKDFNN